MIFKRQQTDKKEIKSRSIYMRIQQPLIILAVLNAFLLLLIVSVMRVPYQLNKNSYDLCQKQVDNRQRYLQSQMTDNWMQIHSLADVVNRTADRMIREEELDFEKLDSSTAECTPLILEVVDDLIRELYFRKVSGIYLTFNTHDLNAEATSGNYKEKTGIYIRDKDPLSASSEEYADLLLECSPAKVVQTLSLSTDRDWEQKMKFSKENPYEDWFTEPYLMARAYEDMDASDCGLWSVKRTSDGKSALTYSIPLILSDGRVYGVLGVEILNSYLEVLLPHSELDEKAFYGLLVSDQAGYREDIDGRLYSVTTKNSPFELWEELSLSPTEYNGLALYDDAKRYEVALAPLSIYSRNTPFDNQKWYVLGAVPTGKLFAFSNRVRIMLIVSSLIIFLFGILGALAASQHISKPIRDVQQEVLDAGSNIIPELSRTGVREVDDLASAITGLSQRVVNSSKRFLSIMEMSSIEMGGYEVDEKNDFLFITENFFLLFNRRDLIPSEMTVREFLAVIRELKEKLQPEQITMNSRLYTIRDQAGMVRYIHVQESKVDGRMIGVAEDVTIQTIEKKHIEHERDYDMLTGLYNRRAFIHDAQKLVENPSELDLAIAVMIDLDDLKLLNDTYGHEWGDLYIASCAKCIQKSCAVNSICARVSGDEFNILMYGFRDREEAGKAMERLWKRFADTVIRFPDGKEHSISASGGYVFIRDDVRDIMEYIKYADFAMYEIKRGKKGGFREFDPGQYLANENEKEKHSIFRRIVSGERIRYVFQPIISARTGNIYGCEALMRIMDSEGMNLAEFLRIAREEDALGDVEHLTWFNALPAFLRLVEQNLIPREAKLFINSQVSHMLSEEEQKYLIEEYGEIRDNVVMEVLETDELAIDFSVILQQTQELFAREYALDDYGTGYNSEKNLISLMPKYIKIDIALIRDVEKYQERQKLITGLLSFAHEKNMLVLAEGVETMAELRCLLTMGVDMFQGYLFARPSDTPNVLNKEAMDMVKSFMN